ncbi:TonB-dependent hemoglobin/transferrin/lactoferrin family receptor [Mangrovicoccus algicola]|uniref:TonB-dependent hemoglobin/transferrin/lactoferrin family receptor n=1 Tax=Mangrovicoccus algicola TaxID=2771008 RepID=A0A8J7D018_9RHOB|nr:TonB-dependent hemoglobin/transferrin/lactoferrin family receptor [Mangrovicoccus algicola]MBE3638803.1 TonB-dependent hemoglobin/transferrin/lactoferrin family receptor [Mangrovicoccus algicola]
MIQSHSLNAALRATAAALLVLPMAGAAFGQEAPLRQEAETEEADPTKPLLLEPITVYAERREAAANDVAASVVVIPGEEIDDRGLDDMHELMRYTPGVTVPRQTTSTDPFSSFGGFNIRGVGGNRVQMVVDGSRVAERITDGTRDYVDLNFTKQVEVVKGPASVLWGSDALGGVVAIQTLDPADILRGRDRGGFVRAEYDGLDKGTGVSAAFAQQFGPGWAVMLGLSRRAASEVDLSNARDDGGIYGCPRDVEAGATPCGELNPMDTITDRVLAKAVWTPVAEHRLEFSIDMLKRNTEVQYNNGLGAVLSSFTGAPTGETLLSHDRELDLDRTRYAVEHTWTPGLVWLDTLRTTLAYTPHKYDRTGLRDRTLASGARELTRDSLTYQEKFYELDIQATSRFDLAGIGHEVTWGFDGDFTKTDYERLDVTRNLTTGTVTRSPAGGFNFANADTTRADLYLQDRMSFLGGSLEVTPGVRYATYKLDPRPDSDYAEIEGAEPRVKKSEEVLVSLGALYRFGGGWQVWGHYGEGFKMPTAQQYYTSLPSFDLIPAPDLKPESVKSIEIGLRHEAPRHAFGITAFDAKYEDFIQNFWQIPETGQITYRNLSKVHIWGVEFDGQVALTDRLRLTGAATWQEGSQKADADSKSVPHTLPPLTATAGLSWAATDALTLDLVGIFADDVTRTESEDRFEPDGYALFDVFAIWQVTRNATLNLGVKNLFDKRYFEANAATYGRTASSAVAAANPIELQTGPGRVFTASLQMEF